MFKIEGYKSQNGNYITKKEVQKMHNENKKMLAAARKQKEIDLQKEIDYKHALYSQEKQERKQLEINKEIRIQQTDKFIKYASENLSNSEYRIAYDMICYSDHYIQKDINNKRVTIDAVKDVYKIACNMIDDFNFQIELLNTAITWEEFDIIHEKYLDSICGDWKEITADQFEDMLNVLPPMRWENGGFYMSERYTADVTGYYQQIGDKYYTSNQRLSYKRDDILNSLNDFINSK